MFLPYGFENRFQEASVFAEGLLIVMSNRCFYGDRGSGCHDFESADKTTNKLSWRRIDSERQDAVDEPTRHNVDQATTFFKPGVLPSLNHGVSLVSISKLSKLAEQVAF
jgi:hypothetical protein